MPLQISVIIPYHNSESTLERTLTSLFGQTGCHLQLILVNDGSTDTSFDTVNAYLKAHPTDHTIVHISYPYSRGASEAFNIGLKQATAPFICKCDSDDTISPGYYSRMLDCARSKNADIVVSPITVHKGTRSRIFTPSSVGSLNNMAVNTPNFSLCNKIIKRTLLTDNAIEAYPHIDRWEDLGIMSRIFALRPKLASINYAGYNYYLTPGVKSLSRSKCSDLLRDHLMTALLLELWFRQHALAKEYAIFLHHLKFLSKVKLLRCAPRNVARWKATFPETNRGIMHLSHISLPHKLLFTLIAKLPTGLSQWVADIIASTRR